MAAAADGDERGRSWYLSKEEIERGSPSRRDGVGAAKEDQLRATYCAFIRDVSLRLRLPQITIATGMVLCHRFYLHQSHAKNEWQTVATACIFLASKIEDTPCQLERVVIVGHETMYKKNPVAARRINQKVILEKQKALILAGEALLLSTIRYDFNIQHPYEPLNVALKNLGISQKEVKQSATNLINDTLRTTLVVQLKPHYIAAGSLSLAARFHNVRLPTEKGKVWWQQFDIAPKLLEAAIQQMKELFMKRNQLPKSPAIQSTPAQTPVEKQQIVSTTPAIRPIPAQTLVEKQQITSTTPAIWAVPAQTPVEKQPTISTSPAIRPIPAQTLMEEQQTIITAPAIRPIPAQDRAEKQQKRSMTPAIRPIPAQTPVEKQQTISKTPAIRSVPAQDPVEKQQTRSTTPAIRPIPAQTPVEKQQTRSKTPAIRSVPAQDPVEKQQTRSKTPAIRPIPAQTPVEKQQTISMTPAIRPFPAQTPVEKQQIISTTPAIQPTSAQPPVEKQQIIGMTPAIRPVPAQTPVEKQQIISTTPAIQTTSAQPPVEKQQIISFPKPVLKYTYSRRGLKRPAPDPVPSPTLVEKQQMINTVGPVLGQELSTSGGLNRPVLATTTTPAPVKKQKIRSTPDSVGHTQSSVGGTMPTRAPARARTPVRKQKIRTQDSVPRHTRPSAGGERRPAPAPARARTPVRKQQIISIQVPVLRHPQPSVGGERRSTTALARSPVRKQQTISTPDSDLRHTNPSFGGERKPTADPVPARARSPVRKPHTLPSAGGERRSSAAPARSPVRKEQIISTPDSVLRDTNPSVGGERQPTTAPAPARARSPVRKPHTHPSAGGERRSATASARSPVRKEQIISTPDSLLRHTNPSQRGLKSNNFDRHASRRMRVDSSVHRDSTDSSARNEDSMPQRMHVDHSLNKTAKDGRPEVLTLREALRADHVYHVRSGPKDVNMARVANFVSKKRKIQEAGEHPTLVNKPDGDTWTRPQIRSVIVAPQSWKKQKI
ncbi:hypothetical protein ACQ4PT_032724 [Festuca glaucescens]